MLATEVQDPAFIVTPPPPPPPPQPPAPPPPPPGRLRVCWPPGPPTQQVPVINWQGGRCRVDTTLPVAGPTPSSFYVSGRAPEDLSAEQARLECDRVAVYVNLNSSATCTWFSSHFTVLFEFPKGDAKKGEPMNNLPVGDVVMTGWQWEQHVELTPLLETIVSNPNIGPSREEMPCRIWVPTSQDWTSTSICPEMSHT